MLATLSRWKREDAVRQDGVKEILIQLLGSQESHCCLQETQLCPVNLRLVTAISKIKCHNLRDLSQKLLEGRILNGKSLFFVVDSENEHECSYGCTLSLCLGSSETDQKKLEKLRQSFKLIQKIEYLSQYFL